MDETHEGVCGMHIRGRSLATKILRASYYWQTMKTDCVKKVQYYENCQKCAPITHTPAELLHTSETSWPFDKWGLDILEPFLVSRGDIVTDNGRQFIDRNIASFLAKFKIKHHFSSVEHPQTNGIAEAANKVILQALRKKLANAKGHWADLILKILWSYNTMPYSTTKETPFRLVYGAESMILVEIAYGSLRIQPRADADNEHIRRAELDTIDEDRMMARIRKQAMQHIIQ
ncbi:uncharacterized protein [Arachis hypogaea]|uniref:uncharacterized protein n=1 Tax=Arachis hypogaea TaxID=3818 RepID=UPI003B21C10A